MTKAHRQHRVSSIREAHSVTSQAQVVEVLEAQGITATQATVSRDLDELGAIKVRISGGETIYAIPELPIDRVAPEDHLRRVLGDWMADVVYSGNLVVLRTPPGSAHVVASALDRAGMNEILGTVAGDDTMIVVAAEEVGGKKLAARLRELAGMDS
jgi:transcriptional regulator of arginine metabolism